ncbi:MAG: hypothetical protein AB2693_34375 [Candidatus Thiodiazotropha sp.]
MIRSSVVEQLELQENGAPCDKKAKLESFGCFDLKAFSLDKDAIARIMATPFDFDVDQYLDSVVPSCSRPFVVASQEQKKNDIEPHDQEESDTDDPPETDNIQSAVKRFACIRDVKEWVMSSTLWTTT